MTEADRSKLKEAFKPVPYMVIGGHEPRSQQENANAAWAELGKRMGFDHMTVRPIQGKGIRFFSAVPRENETQRAERVAREQEVAKQREITQLQSEIGERQARLRALGDTSTSAGDPNDR
jgi:hypothetical protein